jgi:BMFP domain-containing protein YqiC
MQTKNPILNDFSRILTGAFGVAQNARTEMETAVSSMLERWLSERNFVTRDEFDAVRIMAKVASERNTKLEKRVLELEKNLLNINPMTIKIQKSKIKNQKVGSLKIKTQL